MYKDPQLSERARALRAALKGLDVTVTHSQALEAVSRMEGARTLHVAQARNNAGVRIADVARLQAENVMFDSLGRYEGRLDTLLEELRTLSLLDASQSDKLFRSIFRSSDGVVMSEGYESLRAEDVPAAFEALVQRLAGVMVVAAKAPAQQERSPLFEGPMLDWQALESGADAPQHARTQYRVEVRRDKHQFYLDIVPAHDAPEAIEGMPQMTLFVEVNDGLPCVHVSNDRYGDQVLTVFATGDGLYLRPDSSDLWIQAGAPTSETPGLQAQYVRETSDPLGRRAAMNHAFIPTVAK